DWLRQVYAPALPRTRGPSAGGENRPPPVSEFAGCDFVQIVAERLRKRTDALACNSLSSLRVGGAFEHHQFFEELELNFGPKISNGKDDPELAEVGRRFVSPLLIETYCSHDSIDRQNGEQYAFVKSVQIPFLKESLRREAQRRC